MEQEEVKTPVSNGTSIKEGVTGLFNNVKTPVFWVALGYIACKFMDRKKS